MNAPNGFKDATTDRDLIAKWFADGPINIGIRTGAESGLVVLDVDFRNGGKESFEKLGNIPRTPHSKTGGGFHYYFKHPGDRIKSQHDRLGPGLDIKADGGYVVAPPSLHASGNEYRWLIDIRAPLADVPTCFLETSSGRQSQAEATRGGDSVQAIHEGARNDKLTSLTGTMRRRGMGYEAIHAALTKENEVRCTPPLSEKDVERIARSVSSYDPAPNRFNLTDAGNGERFASQHGEKIRYCWT
jgi:hypothetical protein